MYASTPARFQSMRLVPNTMTSTGARVVAACEPDLGLIPWALPEHNSSTLGLAMVLVLSNHEHPLFPALLRMPISLHMSRGA